MESMPASMDHLMRAVGVGGDLAACLMRGVGRHLELGEGVLRGAGLVAL